MVDTKSLQLLEFVSVKEIVAGYSSFDASRHLIMGLVPSNNIDIVAPALARSREARHLVNIEPGFNMDGIKDIRPEAQAASRGKMLEPPVLLDVQSALSTCHRVKTVLFRHGKILPLIFSWSNRIVELQSLVNAINTAISPSGEVLSSASTRLGHIRNQLRLVREQLIRELNGIIKSESGQNILQDPIITQREGRYVVPVRLEHKRDIKGIIHDVSNTGATVFIEPWSTVETGNELKQLELEEIREVERVLSELSTSIGSYSNEITANIEIMSLIDTEIAKARFASATGAVEPRVTRFDEDRSVKLVKARHPLLKGKAVPLDLEMGTDYTSLVITGPNTGGKTVALKTIGLISAMTQSGLPVPLDAASHVPLFDSIFADIGDEQSIEATLSSFSWHMSNISRILRLATRQSLVLMDELGTSTDPLEGSALAAAIIVHFLDIGTTTVATSHFNELKALAHTTPGICNAAFEFDPDTLLPTYKLVTGIPGGSNALITAARLGVSEDIIDAARQRLSKQDRKLDSLLFQLASEQSRLKVLSEAAEKEREQALKLRSELEVSLKQLRIEKENLVNRARDEAVRQITDLSREIKGLSAELQRNRTRQQLESARTALAESRRRLHSTLGSNVPERREDADPGIIQAGDTVLLDELGVEATVTDVNQSASQVTAESGSLRVTLDINSVTRLKPASKPKQGKIVNRHTKPAGRGVSLELDLRGRRADEIEWLLEGYLSDAVMANLETARIIHGHGTGVLRQIVREYVAGQPLVKSFRPGQNNEGGDGVTVITLK